MVGIIQRLIQVLFIGVLIFAAVKPEMIPYPIKPYAYSYSRLVIGDTVSFSTFSNTWKNRWETITRWLPQLKGMKAPWPEPPETITADWILTLMHSTFVEGPLYKWEEVKRDMLNAPLTPISSPSGTTSQ